MRILLTGGGTGGHIFPLVAVSKQLKILAKEKGIKYLEIYYLGPDDFGENILELEGIKFISITTGKLRRYLSAKNIIDIFKIPVGFIQSLWYMFHIMPDVVFSKGGYGSFPVIVASRLYFIPIIIHESDSIPGISNKITSGFAKKIAISFQKSKEYFKNQEKIVITGNPIREDIKQGLKEEAKKIFNLSGGKPIIFILGGSLGSKKINDLVLGILSELLLRYEIIHQCGKTNFEIITKESKAIVSENLLGYYHPYPFMYKELKHAYAAADIIISRAGAGSIFEIACVGKPSIIIPLSNSAQNHQKENAYYYASSGAAISLEESNLTPNILLDTINKIYSDPTMMERMKIAAKNFSKPEAAKIIAENILDLLIH